MKELSVLHFNDAYQISSKDALPGAARFAHKIKEIRGSGEHPLLLTSGDFFSPSLMSTIFKGKQMATVFQLLNVEYSCIGNHDFDFGIEQLQKLIERSKGKWMLGNLVHKITRETMVNALKTDLFEWNGIKVGIFAVVEDDWVEALAIDVSDYEFLDFIEESKKFVQELKSKGAQVIIALTHCRLPNDEKIAENVEGIDLILGGHDHFYASKKIKNTWIVKSGCDFKHLSYIKIRVGDTIEMDVEKIDIDLKMQEDEEMKQVIEGFSKQTEEKLDKLIGKSGSPIDTRSSTIRTGEAGFGNLICDVIRHMHECDFVIVNSGIIRSDTLYPEGNITMRNLIEIVPFDDAVVVIKVSGNDLKKALENGFSKFPKQDGRFPQIGGFKVQWDPRREPGDRVMSMTKLDGQPILPDEIYTLGTKQFMTEKHDGYDVLSDKEFVVDIENGPPLSILMRNYFLMLKVLSKMNKLISSPAHRGVQNFLSKIKKKKKFDLIYPDVDNRLINVELLYIKNN